MLCGVLWQVVVSVRSPRHLRRVTMSCSCAPTGWSEAVRDMRSSRLRASRREVVSTACGFSSRLARIWLHRGWDHPNQCKSVDPELLPGGGRGINAASCRLDPGGRYRAGFGGHARARGQLWGSSSIEGCERSEVAICKCDWKILQTRLGSRACFVVTGEAVILSYADACIRLQIYQRWLLALKRAFAHSRSNPTAWAQNWWQSTLLCRRRELGRRWSGRWNLTLQQMACGPFELARQMTTSTPWDSIRDGGFESSPSSLVRLTRHAWSNGQSHSSDTGGLRFMMS